MSQENEQQYTEHYLKHACIIDIPEEQRTSMRMDYLHAAERADNLMECLNLMQLIKMEYSKFKSGEYKDDEYKQQLEKAYEIAAKKFHGDNEEYQRDIQAKATRCVDRSSIPSSPATEPDIEPVDHKPYIIDQDGENIEEVLDSIVRSIKPDPDDPITKIDFSYVTRLKCYPPKEDNNG